MKIVIFTQPLGHNYGGLLQAYALQKYLGLNGIQSLIVDMPKKKLPTTMIIRFVSFCKRLLLRYAMGKKSNSVWVYHESAQTRNKIYENLNIFKNHYLKLTDVIMPNSDFSMISTTDISGYIVGSDQVWRPKYSPYQPHYFLDFVKDKIEVKRIAYAASFGVDDNEFSDKLLGICKPLAQKFDAISVREDSGIELCKKLFEVNAVQVLDPTLLLDAEHYTKLSYERDDFSNDGNLFTYVLDENNEKQQIIDAVIRETALKSFRILPKSKYKEVGIKHIEDCVLPPIEQWLRGFVDAKYVVTDSFHGTVFSILFKRPFIAIANSSRGVTRFTSLLKLFGLEDRLVLKPEDVTPELINKPIDYKRVYTILEAERKKSKKFLMDALNIEK